MVSEQQIRVSERQFAVVNGKALVGPCSESQTSEQSLLWQFRQSEIRQAERPV